MQAIHDVPGFMMPKPQQVMVSVIGGQERGIFLCERPEKFRIFQLSREPCCFFRIIVSPYPGQAGQIALRLFTEVMVKEPDFFRKLAAFVSLGFRDLDIGGKLSGSYKMPDPACRLFPWDEIRPGVIPCGAPAGKMDAVPVIPRGEHFRADGKAIAAVVDGLQIGCNPADGFLLFKGCDDTFAVAVCVAAEPQHMVYFRLRKFMPAEPCVPMEHIFGGGLRVRLEHIFGGWLRVRLEHIRSGGLRVRLEHIPRRDFLRHQRKLNRGRFVRKRESSRFFQLCRFPFFIIT